MEGTEEPTPRRLRRALERGDSPISSFAVRTAAFAVVVVLGPATARAVESRFTEALASALRNPEALTPSAVVGDVVLLAGPALACAAIAALVVGLVQTGGMVAFRSLAPNLERLAPAAGLSRLFDGTRWRRSFFGLASTALVGGVAIFVLRSSGAHLAASIGHAELVLRIAGTTSLRIAWLALAVSGAVSLADVVASRSAWRTRQRMTRRELKDEEREASGDPEARRRRRRTHEEAIGR